MTGQPSPSLTKITAWRSRRYFQVLDQDTLVAKGHVKTCLEGANAWHAEHPEHPLTWTAAAGRLTLTEDQVNSLVTWWRADPVKHPAIHLADDGSATW